MLSINIKNSIIIVDIIAPTTNNIKHKSPKPLCDGIDCIECYLRSASSLEKCKLLDTSKYINLNLRKILRTTQDKF